MTTYSVWVYSIFYPSIGENTTVSMNIKVLYNQPIIH